MRYTSLLRKAFFIFIAGQSVVAANASVRDDKEIGSGARAFEQLGQELPTPNVYRTASGAPGVQYWQQRADYDIDVTLDAENKRIIAKEVITYTNNSPDTLRYLWVMMDQNRFRDDSLARRSETSSQAAGRRNNAGKGDRMSYSTLYRHQGFTDRDHGFEVSAVKDGAGRDLKYTVVDTMMRIDLPQALGSGEQTVFSIAWEHNIIHESQLGGRGGYEHFEDDDTYIFGLAQWFPRMAAYSDYDGWLNKAFLGRGEFGLEFGDYNVAITLPADHIVSATGVLQNPNQVLTGEQRKRLEDAKDSDRPIFIVTPEEAAENEKETTKRTKTWRFAAENVRDFAWSSSNKYIWDAMGYRQDDAENPLVMVMSFYPNEAEPIWSKYSSHAVAHTMDVYNRFSFNYPYPTAQSVNSWKRGGMEYPMITFNGYRPTEEENVDERTYSRRIKYGLIGVIIHEIGHIYFPMIVNSDERQWTWMDEGLNTFLEYTAEIEWEENYPAFGNDTNVLDYITTYMTSANQVPIMTQSDSILQFGPNAYSKPAAALTVLRETVMGRELFDFAFREYSERWKFKRPTPADFFRTMEDASGIDLDWFWRGWFYTTDHVDISIDDVRAYQIATLDPEVDMPRKRAEAARDKPEPLVQSRNRDEGRELYVDRFPELKDFYNENDRFEVTNADRNKYIGQMGEDGLEPWEKRVLEQAIKEDQHIYFADFSNIGGLVMPIPLTVTYVDGDTEELMIPAEIWRQNAHHVTKLIIRDKAIASIELDKHHEIADADRRNNHFPRQITPSRLELFKRSGGGKNQMQKAREELKSDKKENGDDWQIPMRRPE